MAISLRQYEPQVRVSGEGTAVQLDPNLAAKAASAEDLITADVVQTLGGIASDFFKVKQEHKDKADLASYNNYKTEWASNLEIQKQQALLEGGVSQDELYDTVVRPAQQQFNSWVNGQDFSKQISEQVRVDFDSTIQGINTKEKLAILEHRINERNFTLQQDAERKEYEAYQADLKGDAENANRLRAEAEENWKSLEKTTKAGAVAGMRSSSAYGILNSQSAVLAESLALNEITPEQYLAEITSLRKEIENSETLDEKSKYALASSLTFKIANVAGKQAQAAKQLELQIRKDFAEAKIDAGWAAEAVGKYGEGSADLIIQTLQNSLNAVAADNKNVRKLMDMVNQITTSPMTYIDILEQAAKKGGQYGEEIRELAAIIAGEYVEENASLSYAKYSGWEMMTGIKQEYVTAPYTGWVADIFKEIVDASAFAKEGDYADQVQTQMRLLIDAYDLNNNPTDEEITKIKSSIFGKQATDIALRTTAPTLNKRVTGKRKPTKESDPLGLGL